MTTPPHDHERAIAELGVCTVCALAARNPPPDPPTLPDPVPRFDGATYNHEADHARLGDQMRKVLTAVIDGEWHTLAELAAATDAPEASVSARLRDLRKPQFGGYTLENNRGAGGTWRYRLHIPPR